VAVDAVRARFPRIPGVAFPADANRFEYVDYGPRFSYEWTRSEPPRPVSGLEYAVLVPQVDVDGNDVAGIRAPEIQVPLATYTGWNLRHRKGLGAGTPWLVHGSFLPFARDAAEGAARGDPRRSIAERYPTHTRYLAAVARAVERLLDE
jgi:hypothetical protein